jgi:cation diffusion facilitator family transporter
MAECGCEIEATNRAQSRVLVVLLLINAVMFAVELVTGLIAQSTGLIADALDMLADATVYAIGLYAVGRSALAKAHAAHISGWFQILLALGVAADVLRRWVWGSEPVSSYMMGIGALALVANIVCLVLIAKHRQGEVHMRASWVFSRNDVIANLGVIIGGALVAFTGSRFPDLVIGAAITVLVLNGGVHIIRDARAERRRNLDASSGRGCASAS